MVDDDTIQDIDGIPLAGVGAHNGDFAEVEAYRTDKTPPSGSIGSPSRLVTHELPVYYRLRYATHADYYQAKLDLDDVILSHTDTATGNVRVVNFGSPERGVVIEDISGSGTLGITIKGGSLSDNAGNVIEEPMVGTPFLVGDFTPMIEPIGPKSVNENETLEFTVWVRDIDGDESTIQTGVLPEGAIFNTDTNVFNWTPTLADVGTHTITFTVTDDGLQGASSSESIEIRVENANGSTCFIATAAYGTPLAGEIRTLRTIRDDHLLSSSLGSAFVDTYYRLSPPVAKKIAQSSTAQSITRGLLWLLLNPAYLLGALASYSFGYRMSRAFAIRAIWGE